MLVRHHGNRQRFLAIRIQPGDEVFCTTVTYHATATPALHFGTKIVLVDGEHGTGNINIEAVAATEANKIRKQHTQ